MWIAKKYYRNIRGFLSSLTILTLHLNISIQAIVVRKSTSLPQKFAVIGATGKLGRETVTQLSSRGIPTKCLIRFDIPNETITPSIETSASSKEVAAYLAKLPGVELVRGDLSDKASISNLVNDCTACLALHGASRRLKITDLLPWTDPESDPSHAKQANYVGVSNVIAAVKESPNCNRIVRITGKGEDPWGIFSILINLLGGMAKAWNYEGEELLRGSGIDYTIIRPGVMGPPCPDGAVLALADDGGDLKVSPVKYSSIATLCIDCLEYDNTRKSTLCAMNVPPGEGEESYAPLLAGVKPDRRQFPKSLMAEHRLATRVGAFGILAVLSGVLFGLLTIVKSAIGMLS